MRERPYEQLGVDLDAEPSARAASGAGPGCRGGVTAPPPAAPPGPGPGPRRSPRPAGRRRGARQPCGPSRRAARRRRRPAPRWSRPRSARGVSRRRSDASVEHRRDRGRAARPGPGRRRACPGRRHRCAPGGRRTGRSGSPAPDDGPPGPRQLGRGGTTCSRTARAASLMQAATRHGGRPVAHDADAGDAQEHPAGDVAGGRLGAGRPGPGRDRRRPGPAARPPRPPRPRAGLEQHVAGEAVGDDDVGPPADGDVVPLDRTDVATGRSAAAVGVPRSGSPLPGSPPMVSRPTPRVGRPKACAYALPARANWASRSGSAVVPCAASSSTAGPASEGTTTASAGLVIPGSRPRATGGRDDGAGVTDGDAGVGAAGAHRVRRPPAPEVAARTHGPHRSSSMARPTRAGRPTPAGRAAVGRDGPARARARSAGPTRTR